MMRYIRDQKKDTEEWDGIRISVSKNTSYTELLSTTIYTHRVSNKMVRQALSRQQKGCLYSRTFHQQTSLSHERPGHLVTPSHPHPVQHLTEPLQPDRNLIDLLRVIVPEAHLGDLLMKIEVGAQLRTVDEEMRRRGTMEVVVDTRGVPGE